MYKIFNSLTEKWANAFIIQDFNFFTPPSMEEDDYDDDEDEEDEAEEEKYELMQLDFHIGMMIRKHTIEVGNTSVASQARGVV